MPERIVIKALTGSDLTFIDSFFKRSNIGNQKAINLNANVFAKQLYPDFAERSAGKDVEVPVSVTVFGPRPGKSYRFARSITKKMAYKNWRLNGAAVPDPDGEPGRFDHLAVGDIAVIEFEGDAAPEAVRIVLVSSADDPELHRLLNDQVPGGRRTMVRVARPQLSDISATAVVAADHPIQALLKDPELDEIVEEIERGAAPAVRRLRERTSGTLTKSDLEAARDRIQRIGDDGEAIANLLLERLTQQGVLPAVYWVANDDAASSWDFETSSEPTVRWDAKATTRRFETPFHISGAETVAAADEKIPYRIIRVYKLEEDGAMVRISRDINEFARDILRSVDDLPDGVLPVGFTCDPRALEWDEPIRIDRPDEPELF